MLGIERQNKCAITQACIVSGQPVESTFMIELEERFVDSFSDQTEIDAMEVDVDLLVNGEIPVGECLCQWIGVCAPAWPRAENVPVLGESELDNTENHPFARLSELKNEFCIYAQIAEFKGVLWMKQPPRISLDAMGGDHAPEIIVQGADRHLPLIPIFR